MPDFKSQLSSCFSRSQTLEITLVIWQLDLWNYIYIKKPLSQFVSSSPKPGPWRGCECVPGQSQSFCSRSQSFKRLKPSLFVMMVQSLCDACVWFYMLACIFIFYWWSERLQPWAYLLLSKRAVLCSNVKCCTSIFVNAPLSGLVIFAYPRLWWYSYTGFFSFFLFLLRMLFRSL